MGDFTEDTIAVDMSSVFINGMGYRSRRTADLAYCFGTGAENRRVLFENVRVKIGPGRIVAFTGPSGCGKSSVLAILRKMAPTSTEVNRVVFPSGRALVDTIAPRGELKDAMELLNLCALGSVPLWFRSFGELSTGEQARARLARGISHAAGAEGDRLLLIDEFATGLHRTAAMSLAYNLRRLVTRKKLRVVVACCDESILSDLQPDTHVSLSGDGGHVCNERVVRSRPISFWRRLRIEPGCKRDYSLMAHMHYRRSDELGFVDRIFVLRDGAAGRIVAIVVYSYPPAELAIRNAVTGGQYSKNLAKLNRDVRILRRLIVHPDMRGCGIGHRFVRRTLPLVGRPYVECLAGLGLVNPVFERAGMERVGVCQMPARRRVVVEQLRAMGVDPCGLDFEEMVCRIPRVRQLVKSMVHDWYAATTGQGRHRVERQSPVLLAKLFRSIVGSRPVYYLWKNKSLICKDAVLRGRPSEGVDCMALAA